MKPKYFIEKSQKEGIGKYFLSKAVVFATNKEFGKSYEFLKEGLDILTCDCPSKNWKKTYDISDKKLFEDLNINHLLHYEYYFVKAYILSFEKDLKNLYLALDAVDKYQEKIDDEYGYYVRGKILLGLGKPIEAFESFKKATNFDWNPRLLYRMARIKEEFLNEFGLDELYCSFIENPSSPCCARILKKYMILRGKELSLKDGETNELLLSFNKKDDGWNLQNIYTELLESQIADTDELVFDRKDNSPIIDYFLQELSNNYIVFTEYKVENDSKTKDEDEDYNPHAYFPEPDYERDTFNALTDGQYGDYYDWRDSDGDMDNLRDSLGH